jgi:hypothetical protein
MGAILLASPALAGSICIDGTYLVSGETRQISIFDRNANVNVGTFPMLGGQKTPVNGLVVNGSGYINISYQNLTNNSPLVDNSFLHDGDCISP